MRRLTRQDDDNNIFLFERNKKKGALVLSQKPTDTHCMCVAIGRIPISLTVLQGRRGRSSSKIRYCFLLSTVEKQVLFSVSNDGQNRQSKLSLKICTCPSLHSKRNRMNFGAAAPDSSGSGSGSGNNRVGRNEFWHTEKGKWVPVRAVFGIFTVEYK